MDMTRKYEQRARAEKQDETRQRIVEAAVELHGTIGPVATTLSAVAERAGVQRNTLYRHFPDERSLFMACSGHFFEVNPFPDPTAWVAIADPVERARHGLRELYDFYASTEQTTAHVLRDSEVNGLLREVNTLRTSGPMSAIAEALASGWTDRPSEFRATLTLALAFGTWQSLVHDGKLTNDQAAGLMSRMLDVAATDREPVSSSRG